MPIVQARYLLLFVLFAALIVGAQESPPPAEEAGSKVGHARSTKISPWQASVTGKTATQRDAQIDGQLTLRVYEGFNTLGPVYGHRHPAIGVDVTAQMEKCPDGNTRIRALNIGGWQYQVSGDCGDRFRGGDARVQWGPDTRMATSTGAEVHERKPAKVIRCDPATWTCRTVRH